MSAPNDDLDLLLMQYADGELHGPPLHAIEDLLSRDAAARKAVQDYRNLTLALAAQRPDVDFEAQLSAINAAIDARLAQTPSASPSANPSNNPLELKPLHDNSPLSPAEELRRSRYRIGSRTLLTALSLAAAFAVVASIGISILRSPGSQNTPGSPIPPGPHPTQIATANPNTANPSPSLTQTPPTQTPPASAVVLGPAIAAAQSVGSVAIHIGPPPNSPLPQGYAEAESVIVPASRVIAFVGTSDGPTSGRGFLQ